MYSFPTPYSFLLSRYLEPTYLRWMERVGDKGVQYPRTKHLVMLDSAPSSEKRQSQEKSRGYFLFRLLLEYVWQARGGESSCKSQSVSEQARGGEGGEGKFDQRWENETSHWTAFSEKPRPLANAPSVRPFLPVISKSWVQKTPEWGDAADPLPPTPCHWGNERYRAIAIRLISLHAPFLPLPRNRRLLGILLVTI